MEPGQDLNQKTFPDIILSFGPAWWHAHYGMRFDQEFWVDPIARTERWQQQKRLLYERFGEYGLGEKDPAPVPIAGDAYGHRFMSAFWGCRVQYLPDQFPSAIVLDEPHRRMEKLALPDLSESPVIQGLRSEFDILHRHYGKCEAAINFGGSLNNAVSVFGTEIFLVCKQEPELAQSVLHLMGEAVLAIYDQVVCPLNGISAAEGHGRSFGIGDCPVGMISPQVYEEMVLPHDMWLRSNFHGQFNLHHCGIFDRYTESYRPLSFTTLDVGPGSDLRLARSAYPDIPITTYLAVEDLIGISQQKIDAMLLKMVKDSAPARLFPAITVAEAGPEVSDEIVRNLLTAKERILFTERE